MFPNISSRSLIAESQCLDRIYAHLDYEPKDTDTPPRSVPEGHESPSATNLPQTPDAAADAHTQYSTQTITRQLTSAREIVHAMRSQFDATQKDALHEEYALGPSALQSHHYTQHGSTENDEIGIDTDLDVKVQVEQSVTVDYNPRAYERETYRIPRRVWDSNPR